MESQGKLVAEHHLGKLYFDEENHKYACLDKDNNHFPLTSVSAFIAAFMVPFDTEGIATRVASKRGVEVKQILFEWEKTRDAACEMGTRVHANQELILQGKEPTYTPKSEREEKIMQSGQQACKDILERGWKLFAFELPVFYPEYGLAGTVDIVFKRGDEWLIADWKTNNEINKFSKYGNKALPPIDNYDDCEFTRYSIQLNTYRRLLEKTGYINDGDNVRTTIFHLKPDGYEAIVVPQLEELDLMITKFINNKDCFRTT